MQIISVSFTSNKNMCIYDGLTASSKILFCICFIWNANHVKLICIGVIKVRNIFKETTMKFAKMTETPFTDLHYHLKFWGSFQVNVKRIHENSEVTTFNWVTAWINIHVGCNLWRVNEMKMSFVRYFHRFPTFFPFIVTITLHLK